ncbi:MAG TPA: hypothetical protein VN213_19025 [Solirubrobacteraceae bacterium]|nr:hypothetical protein [Solirubrobacteraceae bacterium]
MEYLIPLVLVLVLVGGFVAFLVLNATRRGQSATRADEPDQAPPGVGRDDTPLGDTAEHAGRQTDEGRTVAGQDADEAGGTGQPVHSGYEGTSAAGHDTGRESAHVRRSGEGEGTEHVDFPDVEPPRAREQASERPGARSAAEGEGDGEPAGDERRAGEEPQGEDADRVRPASERLADRGF